MSNPIPGFAQDMPAVYGCILELCMLAIEWASRVIGGVRETPEP